MYAVKNIDSGLFWGGLGDGWGSDKKRLYKTLIELMEDLQKGEGYLITRAGWSLYKGARADPFATVINFDPCINWGKIQDQLDRWEVDHSGVLEWRININAKFRESDEAKSETVFLGVYKVEDDEWEIY